MPNDFLRFMETHGVYCQDPIIADDDVHRFAPRGKKDKDGWYIFSPTRRRGVFGVWGKVDKTVWNPSNTTPHSAEEQKAYMERIAAARKARDTEIASREIKACFKAQKMWGRARAEGASPYLQKKQVQNYGLRFQENCLLVPVCDMSGKMYSLQSIYHDGNKRFLKGGRKKGCHYIIGGIHTGITSLAVLCEGYATGASIAEATGLPVIICFDAGNIAPVIADIRQYHPTLPLIIAADNDQWGETNTGKIKANQAAAQHKHCRVIVPQFPEALHGQKPTDFNDLHVLMGLDEVKKQLLHKPSMLTAYEMQEFLALDIAPREILIHPIIPKQGLCMLYAFRGIGKTHVALGIAFAAASGGQFLKWQAVRPCKVLYLDGEMPAKAIQERVAMIIKNSTTPLFRKDYLKIITPDFQEKGIPSISTPEGQKAVAEHLQGVELVIVDNISTLCRGGRENEAESWLPVQDWALSLRKRGISILFVHHAGKNDQQRGTSRREDVLDTVIALKRPKDYEPSQGARFEVHYEKARHMYGEDTEQFEAHLVTEGDSVQWRVVTLENLQGQETMKLHQAGYSLREIAKELSISKSKAHRYIKASSDNIPHQPTY